MDGFRRHAVFTDDDRVKCLTAAEAVRRKQNGLSEAHACYCVYFGPQGRKLTFTRPVRGEQTRIRGELSGVREALRSLREYGQMKVEVLVVSTEAFKCLTQWMQVWKDNDWKTAEGRPVENADVMQGIVLQMTDMDVVFKRVGEQSTDNWWRTEAGRLAKETATFMSSQKI